MEVWDYGAWDYMIKHCLAASTAFVMEKVTGLKSVLAYQFLWSFRRRCAKQGIH